MLDVHTCKKDSVELCCSLNIVHINGDMEQINSSI